MKPALLPIGMFSRASLLSVKALRSYHASGLLVPASIDPDTGYRSYTVDQLADAAVIVRLRALDVPLDLVADILTNRDPEHTAAVLANHRAAMEHRLAVTERIVAELQSAPSAVTHTPVHVRADAASHTLSIVGTVTAADFPTFLGWAYGRLAQMVAAVGAETTGPPSALYPAEVSDEPEKVEAYVPVAEPKVLPAGEREVTVGEVAAAQVAVLVHAGRYDSIGETYRTLGAWVARHATTSSEPVREHYVVGPDDVANPDGYRTEIAWPIQPGSALPAP